MNTLEKLGKYTIRRELGKGAMGVVYEGYDPTIDRAVAIKTLNKDALDPGESAELLARFKREAQAAGRLNHPNIVAIYEYGEEGPLAYIAMEIVRGQSLRDLFDQNQRFALKDVVRLMGQLLDALDYSHRQGVVHRDIKPANLVLMDDGQLKVTDFGIARLESSTLTQAGTVLGTPSYMSPEQFMGQVVDGRSDLFSAGVVLYQFLTGEKPFSGSSITTIMHKVLKETPLSPSELNVQVPPPFDAVVRQALAKRPDERFQTGHEFHTAIEAAASGHTPAAAPLAPAEDSEATITSPSLKLGPAPASASPAPVAAPSAQPSADGRKWLLPAAGGGVAALALVAYLATGRPVADAPPAPVTEAPASATVPPAAQEAEKSKTAPAPVPKKTADATKKKKKEESAKDKSAKKGVFGEELKPSPWKKEHDLF